VLGAVNAGKSSLVKTLLGAASTAGPGEYEVTLPGGQGVRLLDTRGYGERVGDDDLAAAVDAARDADLLLLATPATCPGRANDVELLDRLQAWFAARPQLRQPPVVVAVTQVDLLAPAAEWQPPYDWQSGTRPKEANIRECVAVVTEQFGPRAAEVVPVCSREPETFGIVEGLVPAMLLRLAGDRGGAVLREIDAAVHERPVGLVFEQLGNVAGAAAGALAGWFQKKK
jgi:predicted GTPase